MPRKFLDAGHRRAQSHWQVGAFDFLRPLGDSNVTAMEDRYTVHNPTTQELRFIAAPFDFSGAPSEIAGVTCWSGELRGSRSNLASIPDVALRQGELEMIDVGGGVGFGGIAGLTAAERAESHDGRVRVRGEGRVTLEWEN